MTEETVNTMMLDPLLQRHILGNTVGAYAVALGVFVVVLLALRLVKLIVIARLTRVAEKTATRVDDFLISLFRYVDRWVYLLAATSLAIRSLVLPGSIEQIVQILLVAVVTVKAIQVLNEVVAFFLNRWAAKTAQVDPTSVSVVRNLQKIAQVVFWVGGGLFVLDNVGLEVTPVIAGLGIGGVAVALAAQTVLADAFSSFAIFMDRPFAVGDFIIVGDMMGAVEHIGFKTTRIRSLDGEQLIFSNSDLTNSRIRNYKRMQERRVVFKFGVVYQTSVEQLKAIPSIVREIVTSHQQTRFDRAHFFSYGDFALIFEVVYYVLSPDYNLYMDVQQHINVGIKEVFQARGIEFAYPTQQLYVTMQQAVPGSPAS